MIRVVGLFPTSKHAIISRYLTNIEIVSIQNAGKLSYNITEIVRDQKLKSDVVISNEVVCVWVCSICVCWMSNIGLVRKSILAEPLRR